MDQATPSTETSLRGHTVNAFATPLLTYTWPDSAALNAELRELILEAEKKGGGAVVRSNVGGWHSETGFFKWDAPCVNTLQERVRALAVEMTRMAIVRGRKRRFQATYRMDAWANVMRSGHYHNVHNHPNNLWSGVYYVSTGKPEKGRPFNGTIEFLDPRPAINMVPIPTSIFELRYTIPPKAGLMVMFPSWLHHLVHPFFGHGERISVAFNVQVGNVRFLDEEEGAA
jgi:uncharacterized protein (TIGR02466 family)